MDEDRNKDAAKEMDDDQRFRRMFSKQLADALRAKEEDEAQERERLRTQSTSGRGRSLGKEDEAKRLERIRSTYVELCHDDPIISGGNADCRQLARALIPNNKTKEQHLALSTRLVEGILQAASRAEAAKASSSPAQANDNNLQPNAQNDTFTLEEQASMFSPLGITTSEGYAEIAFAIFVEGPYRCIQQADNLQIASKFLGSLELPDTSNVPNATLSPEEKSRLVEEATSKLISGMDKMSTMEEESGEKQQTNVNTATNANDDASSSSSEFFHPNTSDQCTQQQLSDSMEEIFAEESDPDDYEYESSYNPYSPAPNDTDDYVEEADFGFDPLQLSEPNATNLTWEGARASIHYLLSCLSYGKLALGSLSSRAWSEGDMSETLADLCFMLLLEHTKGDGGAANSNDSLLKRAKGDDTITRDIAELWDRPLFLLRDRALDKNHGHDALPAYTQLLTAFLSHSEPDVMSILSSPSSKNNGDSASLPPITAVGLSSLAALCSSKEMISASSGRMCGTSVWSVCPREEVKKAIMSSLKSLSRIVECVRPRKSIFSSKKEPVEEESEPDSQWIRTIVCVIPILECITNLQARFDFQPLFEGGGTRGSVTLTNSDAKGLSDSGLFREMLSLFTATRNEDGTSSGDAERVVRMQFLRALFPLVTQSPDVLGNFAMRTPGFVKEVHSHELMEQHIVDGILWTSIGSSLLEGKLGTSKPRLKLISKSKAEPGKTETLAARSSAGFDTMCSSSIEALRRLKELVDNAETTILSDEEKAEYDKCKETLGDVKRFANCLSNCPSATQLWLDSLTNEGGSSNEATGKIAGLRSALATLPSFSDEAKITQQGHKKNDDDDCVDSEQYNDELGEKPQMTKQIKREFGTIVSSVRGAAKVIALALESQKGAGLSVKGPAPCDFSSKTD